MHAIFFRLLTLIVIPFKLPTSVYVNATSATCTYSLYLFNGRQAWLSGCNNLV